jgi:hypothetical protein
VGAPICSTHKLSETLAAAGRELARGNWSRLRSWRVKYYAHRIAALEQWLALVGDRQLRRRVNAAFQTFGVQWATGNPLPDEWRGPGPERCGRYFEDFAKAIVAWTTVMAALPMLAGWRCPLDQLSDEDGVVHCGR